MGLCDITAQRHLVAARDYQLRALAPFPAPRLRAGPWALTRAPNPAAAHLHYYASLAQRRAALTQPPRRPGVATASLRRQLTLASGARIADRRAIIVPAPAHLIEISGHLLLTTGAIGDIYIEIPELGYRRALDADTSQGTNDYHTMPLQIDIDQPVSLVAGYALQKLTAGATAIALIANASLAYRPLGT